MSKALCKSKVSLGHIFNYAIGEGAFSLTMNGIANFAMLYYAQVLGLSAGKAGLALSITLIWDAITDPVMGHITDNTRSRFGRRNPYILIGGLFLAVSFFFLWFVPDFFIKTNFIFLKANLLFWYILVINLIVRTAVTVFVVPYTALGFEICPDYEDRSRLQGVRYFVNQIVNFGGGAMAWSIFFRDQIGADGGRVDGTKIAGNYFNMGIALTIATALMIIYCVYTMRRHAVDTRQMPRPHNDLMSFLMDFIGTISDRYALYVFAFIGLAQLGMLVVAQSQMFTYVNFMKFTHWDKTCAHGAGMLCFALGSLLQAYLVRHMDKKPAAYIGVGFCVFGNAMLLILFIFGLMPAQMSLPLPENIPLLGGIDVHVSVLAFAIFQGMWWGGCGMLISLATSMIADISEINQCRTGQLKDGSYAAVFSFILKAAMAIGMFFNGILLDWLGYVSGAKEQVPEAIRRIAILTFVSGPIIILLALPILVLYPVNRKFMADIRAKIMNN
jgi:GPH family glycoside/pentoside/hexuronide:cation symporter